MSSREEPAQSRQRCRKDTVNVHRLGNILQTPLADVLEWYLHDLPNLIVNGLRNADSARVGELLEANSDVHARTVEIVLFDDNIPKIHANAELHSLVVWDGLIAFRDLVLNFDSAANGLDDAGELGDDAVACAAEDTPLVCGDRLFDHCAVHAKSGRRNFFVGLG